MQLFLTMFHSFLIRELTHILRVSETFGLKLIPRVVIFVMKGFRTYLVNIGSAKMGLNLLSNSAILYCYLKLLARI